MTEVDWLASEDPVAMLDYLQQTGESAGPRQRTWISERKLRLVCQAVSADRVGAGGWEHMPLEWLQGWLRGSVGQPDETKEYVKLANLLRDICGNPFRPLDVFTRALGRWGGMVTPTVLALASAAYDLRTPDGILDPVRLAVLRDALLDAGCEDLVILEHLASLGPHVRGCHVLDTILARK